MVVASFLQTTALPVDVLRRIGLSGGRPADFQRRKLGRLKRAYFGLNVTFCTLNRLICRVCFGLALSEGKLARVRRRKRNGASRRVFMSALKCRPPEELAIGRPMRRLSKGCRPKTQGRRYKNRARAWIWSIKSSLFRLKCRVLHVKLPHLREVDRERRGKPSEARHEPHLAFGFAQSVHCCGRMG